jgi:hypothetical protein
VFKHPFSYGIKKSKSLSKSTLHFAEFFPFYDCYLRLIDNEEARALLDFYDGDAVGGESVEDEADLFSRDGQFECRQFQVVFDEDIEFGVDFPESCTDSDGKAEQLMLLALGEVVDADVAHTQFFTHLYADELMSMTTQATGRC